MANGVITKINNVEIDSRYHMKASDIMELRKNSEGAFELACNSFAFGYSQGMRAAQSAMKRADKGGVS